MLIDFGTARLWSKQDPDLTDEKLLELIKEDPSLLDFQGTPNYRSVRADQGLFQLTYKDDMEAFGFVLYFYIIDLCLGN